MSRLVCPRCGSHGYFKDGLRPVKTGITQRYLCKKCGSRFSEPNNKANKICLTNSGSQLCAELEAKKLDTATEIKTVAGDNREINKGRLVEYIFWAEKQGLAEATVTRRYKILNVLSKQGADLFNSELVKEKIAKQNTWNLKTKHLAVEAYTSFLTAFDKTWNPPKYKPIRKLPFIPSEREVDELIAGCNNKTSTFLQLLKETGARFGEAWQLKWLDFNFENRTVNITPEKGSNPRQLKISNKLIAMLNSLPKNQQQTFIGSQRHFIRGFRRQRKRISTKLKSDRIAKITFHTLRHWKATMEYAKTKDILHVQKILGHKSITNTQLYTQLVDFGSDEYHSATAKTIEEAQKLIEVGFEYVCEFGEYKLFRKRK